MIPAPLFRSVLAGLSLLASAASGATLYSITDLGPADAILGLNDKGQAVGRNGLAISFLYSGAQTILPNPPGGTFHAYGLNNSGDVTGQITFPPFDYAIGLYSGGSLSVKGLGSSVEGYAINDAGQIAGDLVAAYRAMLYSGGVINPIGVLPGDFESTARGINQAGDFLVASIGSSSHAAIFSRGSLNLVSGSAGYNVQPQAINSKGQVVGSSTTGAGSFPNEAILFSGGQATFLGSLPGPGTPGSFAQSINDAGVVVGSSMSALGSRATVYTSADGLQDLTSLLVNQNGWTLQVADVVNNKGEIAGTGLIGGVQHGFLLDPIITPEPASTGFTALGLTALVGLCILNRWQRGGLPASSSDH